MIEEDPSSLVRLHITPFTPALVQTYLSKDVQDIATDLSFHSVQTFPEKSYGYVTLPVLEARKMKKKLNGSILKGTKVSIEDARPSKRKIDDEDVIEEEVEPKKARKEKKKKKVKGQENDIILDGHELEEGRKVKRGWTEPHASHKEKKETRSKEEKKEKGSKEDKKEKKERKEKRQAEKSKYTKEPELLFKTILPPGKVKKDKSDREKKKSKGSSKEVVVHEFEHTKKQATFLKQSKIDTKGTHNFVEGTGWVDEDDNVVEEVKSKPRKTAKVKHQPVQEPEIITTKLTKEKKPKKPKSPSPAPISDDSSSIISSDSSDDSSSSDSDAEKDEQDEPSSQKPTPRLKPTMTLDLPKTPHPLETLFKRTPNTTKPQPLDTFSFFGANDDDDVDEDMNDFDPESSGFGPQTPFTQHVEARQELRSGAPTPDTAAANRRFSFSRGVVGMDMLEEDEEEEPADALMQDAYEEGAEEFYAGDDYPAGNAKDDGDSAFAKWFWEKRGDNNRAWKRRRREALKEKRQRENKRISRRIV
ncbi:hypothetical protein BT63DRAFT_430243 [Microthyrium microscopicum]|uniref:Uncharacterized protein n=1 Tax=Microthyrium microscopicum TaxID=703497 RepID=A0A6A6TV98_9PEZI|nr:hypothetical protein BT63DRAFT_430243 [Microthyrium microscopicum]